MMPHPHMCSSCKREANSYDADRGWSCIRANCPAIVAVRKKQAAFNRDCELKRRLEPVMLVHCASKFTVQEIGWILAKDGPYGSQMLAACAREGIDTAAEIGGEK